MCVPKNCWIVWWSLDKGTPFSESSTPSSPPARRMPLEDSPYTIELFFYSRSYLAAQPLVGWGNCGTTHGCNALEIDPVAADVAGQTTS